MGHFHDFVKKPIIGDALDVERRKLLEEIGRLRKTSVITYAARMQIPVAGAANLVTYEDILPFQDLLTDLTGDRVSVIVETPGGSGEVGRQLVEMLHMRFSHVEFIVPGWAKSTGTIMVMGGHEILMGPGSALGPIDAQLSQEGKTYSADALIEGMENIKKEVETTGKLNSAYIPILQKVSPGELQHAKNALDFARVTVQEWLSRHKFGKWTEHRRTKTAVTNEERDAVAKEIADRLCSQAHWKTHARSITIADLRELGLLITDFSENKALERAILRYQVLLRMTFDQGNVAKVFETSKSTLAVRFNVTQGPAAQSSGQGVFATVAAGCLKCGRQTLVQLDFDPGVPLQPGAIRFPPNGLLSCPNCGTINDLNKVKAEAEAQIGRPALKPAATK